MAHDHHHHHDGQRSAHVNDSGELAESPVRPGSFIDKGRAEAEGLARDYNGTRYWLCCATCGARFGADPAKFIAA